MLKRTGTKQRSDDRTTNLSRLIIIGNLRIEDLFSVATTVVRGKNAVWWWGNQGRRILGVGNRHDNIDPSFNYYAYTNTK